MTRFRARLEPVPHGGCYAPVPERVAARAGLTTHDRVRGTVDGVTFRSSLAKYRDGFHLGVPKAALAVAARGVGDTVALAIEFDDEPLPADVVPPALAKAMKQAGVRATFDALAPGQRRKHVQSVLDAKRPETKARRIAAVVAALA